MTDKSFTDQHFPEVDSGLEVLGGGILIQGKFIPQKSRGGIIITENTRKMDSYDVMIGKVVGIGPLAYKNKETLEPWKEGPWCKIGDIVSIPRTGSRYSKRFPDGEEIHFVLVGDTEVKVVYKNTDGYSFGDE